MSLKTFSCQLSRKDQVYFDLIKREEILDEKRIFSFNFIKNYRKKETRNIRLGYRIKKKDGRTLYGT